MNAVESVDLECRVGDKRAAYKLELKQVSDNGWWVFAHSGKIGASPVKHVIVPGRTEEYARAEYNRRLKTTCCIWRARFI